MTRLERKNRTDIEYKNEGGILDALDDSLKSIHRINDDEYDYLAMKMSSIDMDLFVKENLTFNEKRQLLNMINKHLKNYNDTIRQ